jgi:GT2 family glycosyltransferase
VLRVTEQARRIIHVPEVLYHWRIVPSSVLSGDDVKPYAYEAAAKAVESHCQRLGIDAEVIELERQGHFRVKRQVQGDPLVSIIIPTRGSSGAVWGATRVLVTEAVRSIVTKSTWPNYELIVVADTATPTDVLADLVDVGGERVRIIEYPAAFDFSDKCNLGALHARGDQLLFLNDDTEVIDDDWIESLLGLAQEPTAGAVGAELLFEDGRIQHVGHVVIGGNPGHLMFGRSPRADANRLAVWLDREVAGVTAACLMIRREVFDEVGGFSPEFPGNYNDVDLCHKIRTAGYRVVVTPHARLYHFESMTRDPQVATVELAKLRDRWGYSLHHDPYYNPNYGSDSDGFPEPVHYAPT